MYSAPATIAFIAVPATFFASSLLPQLSHAWNGRGRRVIASIAFQQLEPARRLELPNRIRNHPRFDAGFAEKMPDEVKAHLLRLV